MTDTVNVNTDDGLGTIRTDLRQQRDDHLRLEGELKADRRVANERHMQAQAQNQKLESDIGSLSATVNSMRDAIATVGTDVRSIAQRLDADDTKRIDTAAALREADEARRAAEQGPWVTPKNVTGLVVALLVIAAYITERFA